MEKPLVSVIIPSYNQLKLLQKCLQSVFSQDISDLGTMEVIVVDDGSSDGTWDWLQQIAPSRPNLRLIHLDDVGVAKARNAALDAAQGTYIRFIDGDDELCEDSMRSLLTPALTSHCDFVVGAFYRKIGEKTSLRNAGGKDQVCPIEDYMEIFTRYSTSYYVGVVWNKLFRRDLIEREHIRFASGMFYGEDFLFTTAYMALCSTVAVVSKPVYVYYFNPRGMTVRQVKSCFTHPVKNVQLKAGLFSAYKTLFRKKGLYEKYKLRINAYPVKINFDD